MYLRFSLLIECKYKFGLVFIPSSNQNQKGTMKYSYSKLRYTPITLILMFGNSKPGFDIWIKSTIAIPWTWNLVKKKLGLNSNSKSLHWISKHSFSFSIILSIELSKSIYSWFFVLVKMLLFSLNFHFLFYFPPLSFLCTLTPSIQLSTDFQAKLN